MAQAATANSSTNNEEKDTLKETVAPLPVSDQTATSDSSAKRFEKNEETETVNETLAPLAVSDPASDPVSDPVSKEELISPVHKRPKDDKSKFVRSQNADTVSTVQPQPEPNSDSSNSDDDEKKSSENAPSMQALSKLVETHSLKAVQFPVGVFVRIRPLVGKEVEEEHSSINYAVKSSKKSKTQKLTIKKIPDDADSDMKEEDDAVEMDEAQKKMAAMKKRFGQKGRDIDYKGFRRIILPKSDNVAVFEEAVAPFLSNVMLGQKTCIFSYGHTGSGKTHTIFGYRPDHPGMFELFAKELLSEIADLKGVGVQIRFTELYNRKVYDLLSDDNRQCYLRESDGEFRLRADPVKGDDGMFRAYPVTGIIVKDIESLMEVSDYGVVQFLSSGTNKMNIII